jgi:hypothetical protein
LVLHTLAASPGDRAVRQRAVDRALEVSGCIATEAAVDDAPAAVPLALLQMLVIDTMIFCGVGADEAAAAVQSGIMKARVSPPPAAPRVPFGLDRFTPDRWQPDPPSPPDR